MHTYICQDIVRRRYPENVYYIHDMNMISCHYHLSHLLYSTTDNRDTQSISKCLCFHNRAKNHLEMLRLCGGDLYGGVLRSATDSAGVTGEEQGLISPLSTAQCVHVGVSHWPWRYGR